MGERFIVRLSLLRILSGSHAVPYIKGYTIKLFLRSNNTLHIKRDDYFAYRLYIRRMLINENPIS